MFVGERGKLIVRQSLDTGAELPLNTASQSAASRTVDTNYAHTAAAVLLAFLRSLPESIVPLSLHRRCAEITNRDEAIEVMWLSVVVPRRHG
jgi:inositol polyphosphate 5-phosphatase INPP5B/F